MCVQLTVLASSLPRLFSDKKVAHYPVSEGETSETCPVLFAGEYESRGFCEEAEELGLHYCIDRPSAEWTSKSTACSAGEGIALGLAWDRRKWKEKRKKSYCSQSCACFVNGCCLCLRSQASTFHIFLRKFGSNSGSEYFPAQRVYILSKPVWDTELRFVSDEGFDCFNGLQRLWAGSCHYSPSMSHCALCTSGAVKRTTELVLVSCSLKLNCLLSFLRVWKSLGHQERPSQAGLS